MAIRLLALVLLAATVAACSAESATTSVAEPSSTTTTLANHPSTTTTSLAEPDDVPALAELPSTTISIDGRDLVVAVADTAEVRRRGLMGVTDLGGLDGMLFVWTADTGAAFWMKNTLIPLDIAFFSVNGSFVDRLFMEPCTADPCALYSAAALYRYALEAPAGDLEFASLGSKLVIESDS